MVNRMPARWTFLSNHGHVLLQLAADDSQTMRSIAQTVGITERAVQLIVHDLAADGYVTIERVGRRNRYQVVAELPLRHPAEQGATVGSLIALLQP